MKLKALLPLVPLSLASALGAGIWTPNQALYLRTNNLPGADFTGETPSNDLAVIATGVAAVDAGGELDEGTAKFGAGRSASITAAGKTGDGKRVITYVLYPRGSHCLRKTIS